MTNAVWADEELDLGLDSGLRSSDELVARMPRAKREERLDALLVESTNILDETIETFCAGKRVVGRLGLFSGGNDSTTLIHMFRDRLTHTAHANTTVGIEATREFVRNTSAAYGLPLMERTPPRAKDHYRALVLGEGYPKFSSKGTPIGGFPGPAMHYKMYHRLKLRAISQMCNELVENSRQDRVVLIGGRRRAESHQRASIPENGRQGSKVWSAPLVNWTKLDLNMYRLRQRGTEDPVPTNQTADVMHMSGECLCGSFASPGERAQLDAFFFEDIALIRELEEELRLPEYAHIPEYRKTWGWSAVPELAAQADPRELRHRSGGCEGCEGLFPIEEATAFVGLSEADVARRSQVMGLES